MPKKPEQHHTQAWVTYERNLDTIRHMAALQVRELSAITATVLRLSKSLKKGVAKGHTSTNATFRRLARSVNRLTAEAEIGMARVNDAALWQVVMLVTCVETYLQDVLSIAASVDPALMAKSEQKTSYADVMTASSIDELANAMRTRWARGVLRDGGPTRWVSRLKGMGAGERSYPEDLAPRLERFWGIRHVVVHAAGRTTADFVMRHPGVVATAGDRMKISTADFELFVGAVGCFMEPTERFFLRRYPALAATALSEPAQ
jgi:hypothetical protein